MQKELGRRWGICPECKKERPVYHHTQRMKDHNRWIPEKQEMQWCPGTGQSAETSDEKEIPNGEQ